MPDLLRPKGFRQSDIPVPLKLCPNLNGLLSPQISSDVPVKGVYEVSLVERLDIKSTIPVSASQLLVPPKRNSFVPYRWALEKAEGGADMVLIGKERGYGKRCRYV